MMYEKMLTRYQNSELPWDSPLPPPEVEAFVANTPPGNALDLGCGYGRAAIYLAEAGWQVDAVDFIPQAITEAAQRAKAAGVNINFYQADVTDLSFLTKGYDFALDVGCAHSLSPTALSNYYTELKRLLKPNASYLLFARLAEQAIPAEDGSNGLNENHLQQVFADGFELINVSYGTTKVADMPAWSSGWFLFKRT